MKDLIKMRLRQSIETKQAILNDDTLLDVIEKFARAIVDCISNGGKLVICGNGGSASDALHFAGEIVGRFQKERNPWSAIALNADVATLTAIANDCGYDEVFARQARGHLKSEDLFIGISTSGNSENVYRAVLTAKEIGAKTAALLGNDGGKIGKEVDYPVTIGSKITARVQECHITIIHVLCEIAEEKLSQL